MTKAPRIAFFIFACVFELTEGLVKILINKLIQWVWGGTQDSVVLNSLSHEQRSLVYYSPWGRKSWTHNLATLISFDTVHWNFVVFPQR